MVVFAAGFLATQAVAQNARVVNVYNWSDYIDPKVIEDFTKRNWDQGPVRHFRRQ